MKQLARKVKMVYFKLLYNNFCSLSINSGMNQSSDYKAGPYDWPPPSLAFIAIYFAF